LGRGAQGGIREGLADNDALVGRERVVEPGLGPAAHATHPHQITRIGAADADFKIEITWLVLHVIRCVVWTTTEIKGRSTLYILIQCIDFFQGKPATAMMIL